MEDEKDKTEDMEEEELSASVDDADEEGEEEGQDTPGKILFNVLKDYDLVRGLWESVILDTAEQYEAAAAALDITV